MKLIEKNICAFHNWYENFKDLTFKSICIPVPDEVLDYLKKDMVIVPQEAVTKQVKHGPPYDDLSLSSWDSDDDESEEADSPSFPLFSKELSAGMDRLGGDVFIKLNWSAPTDAAWVATNNSLKCNNLQDIYLLLKCSSRIDMDLSRSSVDKFYIVLKKWEDIHPGSEFRCFVTEGELVAITQRDTTEFHSHILTAKLDIVRDIKEFFTLHLKDKLLLPNFVFDVVWKTGGRIKLVDFNTLQDTSCKTYLFTRDELQGMKYEEEISPEFRFIGEATGIQPSNLSDHFGLPRDITDMSSSESRSIIELLQNQIDLQSNEN